MIWILKIPFMNQRSDHGCDYKEIIHLNLTSKNQYKLQNTKSDDPQNKTHGFNNSCMWPFAAYLPTFY